MISIIGAGPVGCYLAYLLAKSGEKVSVFEEHSEIGKPVQCTGIVTSAITELIKPDKKFVINTIKRFKVFSPDENFIEFKLENPNLILDRTKFDKYLARLATKAGAKFYLKKKFVDYKEPYVILDKEISKKTDILVGADGPQSKVAKATGLYGKRKFVIGLQARIKTKLRDKNAVEFYLNKHYFGWLVPESKSIARVGIVAKYNIHPHFKEFMRMIKKKHSYKTICYQSGLIPVYDSLLKTSKNNVYLVGDAACQVKPTSYGGIIQGMMAARELSKAILENKNYEFLWKKSIGKDLTYGSLIRRMMDNFSNEDYNELLKVVNKRHIKKIIEKEDRDFPSKIIFKVLTKEPGLIKFARKII
ncbi:MAG: NAD(P)/FAD-dependent oxidoreductase [Candidatus Nanoarchaeia archaeon]|nr:NAD(P)/FAD-dependent oxidoreductase [Candidatus Nanoarchaeia archaeon]MDD5588037.1 NAD(P)/FAD-dependent oxidoreductase [Candidatus Nanoarchaeia archaeon]